jgi:hypothetical protein
MGMAKIQQKSAEITKVYFHSRKYSVERQICKMSMADTNFPSEKNFEVENFQLLTMIYLATCM